MSDHLPDRFSLLEIDQDPARQIRGRMQPPASPVRQLVLRLEQLESPEPVSPPTEPEPGGVVWRLVEGELPLCARHAFELREYLPGEELRVVLDDDQVDNLVAEFGLRRADVVALYGHRDFGGHAECCDRCALCGVPPNTLPDGSPALCHNDDCRRPLHPQWPVVYCSDACAIRDA